MREVGTIAAVLFALALPAPTPGQERPAQIVRLDRYAVPLNPGEIPEFLEAGLIEIRDLGSGRSVAVSDSVTGSGTRVVAFYVMSDENGEFSRSQAASEENDERLASIVEAALPQMRYEAAMFHEQKVPVWARWEFVFQDKVARSA